MTTPHSTHTVLAIVGCPECYPPSDADLRARYIRAMTILYRLCFAKERGFVDDAYFDELDSAFDAGRKMIEDEDFDAALVPMPEEEQHGPGGCH